MSYKERLTYLILLALGGVFIFYILNIPDGDYAKEYKSKINILENNVDSLYNINNELTSKISTLSIKIKSLDQELYLNSKKIITLKNEINSKVNSVDSFDNDQLKLFFTNRYRQHLGSIQKTPSKVSN